MKIIRAEYTLPHYHFTMNSDLFGFPKNWHLAKFDLVSSSFFALKFTIRKYFQSVLDNINLPLFSPSKYLKTFFSHSAINVPWKLKDSMISAV